MISKHAGVAMSLAVGFMFMGSSLVLAAQQPDAAALVVSSAAPDAASDSLTIVGANFGARPLVTLDLVPLTVQLAIDSRIVAFVPLSRMPAGTYLLTVSRGPAAAESDSLTIALGATPLGTSAAAVPDGATPAGAVAGTVGIETAARDAAAKVGNRVITIAEVDREWQRTDPVGYLTLSRELYNARRRTADQLVSTDLLAHEAAARGLAVEALLAEEIPKRTIAMPDAAVTTLYQQLGDRVRGATLDEMRPALRAWLARHTEPEIARMNLVEELMKVSTRAEILLTAPRVQVGHAAQDAVLGPATAPVEIVAFGDFESADYARLARSFAAVRDMFGDRVRIVFKHLPVLAPESAAEAEAAACANAQGRFWPFHDAIVTRTGPLGSAGLGQLATQAGLDRAIFDACIDKNEAREILLSAVDEAARYGIRRSPSVLVNGRLAPDPPPFLPPLVFFKRLIEEELQHQARSAAPPR